MARLALIVLDCVCVLLGAKGPMVLRNVGEDGSTYSQASWTKWVRLRVATGTTDHRAVGKPKDDRLSGHDLAGCDQLERFHSATPGEPWDVTTWISHAAAAELVGCNVTTIERSADAGRIVHRERYGNRPSLDLASVERFAVQWSEQQAERARRPRAEHREPQPTGPPDDGCVWLDIGTVGTILGWTSQYVARLASDERIPATRRGRRWWLRREDVERYAAAQAFARRWRSQRLTVKRSGAVPPVSN